MNLIKKLSTALAATALCAHPIAAEPLDAVAKDTKKTEVTVSMIGPRDTLIFYVFEDAKAILVVGIGNKDATFPVSAKLHIFAKTVDAEGLGKWINNQHSCGLFPEVPEPEATKDIPAASCKTEAHEAVEQVGQHTGDFTRYSVTFSIKEVPAFGELKLKDFTDKASVFVKEQAS